MSKGNHVTLVAALGSAFFLIWLAGCQTPSVEVERTLDPLALNPPPRGLRGETVALPPLQIRGFAARAHVQGMEIIHGTYYVTARQENVSPKRALLLRHAPGGTGWDVWDITPVDPTGALTALDHPGGFQSDGKRLWIPVAESKRHGKSVIRAYPLTDIVAGQALKPEFEFVVQDHIGALAVSSRVGLLVGASWDTETVYLWNLEGRLDRTLRGTELGARGLGVVGGADGRSGVAVQDWKIRGDELFASGPFKGPAADEGASRSRLMVFARFLEPDFRVKSVRLPLQESTELAREGMAISEGIVHFLPEDLGATNRLFRIPLTHLGKPGPSP